MKRLYISGRERKIIDILLDSKQVATIQTLANQLDVSGRTIHRDLKNVDKVLQKYQLKLNKKAGIGVKIDGNVMNKKKLAQSISTVEYTDYTPEERQAILLATLLEASEPIKLFTLAKELEVTIATISNDLDKLQNILTTYQLTIIRKRGFGVKVDGEETNKRAALSFLISTYINESDFLTFIKENIEKRGNQPIDTISERLLGLVDQEKLKPIEKSIERVRESLPYEFADSSYIGLVVHLALAMERIQQGDAIRFDRKYLAEIKNTKEYKIAQQIITDLEGSFEMKIPVDEIGYITMHLLGAKIRSDHEYLIEDSSINIAIKVKELIQYVGNALNIDLSDNLNLFHDLITHLKPAIYRMQKEMLIKNPLLNEIKTDYQKLFNIIKNGCEKTFHTIYFPEEEIAYLVLHFASATIHYSQQTKLHALVICSSGIGTSKMLASRLSQEITEISTIDNRSLFDLQMINLEDYDLIISTIPLKDLVGEYTLVSPILTPNEIDKIKSIVQRKKHYSSKKTNTNQNQTTSAEDSMTQHQIISRIARMQVYSQITLELLSTFRLEYLQKAMTKEELLTVVCKDAQDAQQINEIEPVIHALLEREKLGGLGIPNTSMALYHTRHKQIKKPTFLIYALNTEHALTVHGMDNKQMQADTIMFMLAPTEISEEILELLSYLSGLIIRNQESINLFQSKDEAKINQFIAHHLNKFVNDKLN
ncbi:BglG family transcription antiterminator [Paraliobacillus ryukyuensis]|uniref:BglG family transcription antiterminator n=1 Tax=Paraliobacillus ryukyuensis TaxID=200904 RepID=UPI0009A656F8|nr:BglG family transcription antiterminator [Paraliobacillus ryukyuensis]